MIRSYAVDRLWVIDKTLPETGSHVRLLDWQLSSTKVSGYGIIIELIDNNAKVLWSDPPEEELDDGITSFFRKMIKRVNYASIASQLITIQPMSAPTGQIFYLDYNYGSSETLVSGTIT